MIVVTIDNIVNAIVIAIGIVLAIVFSMGGSSE